MELPTGFQPNRRNRPHRRRPVDTQAMVPISIGTAIQPVWCVRTSRKMMRRDRAVESFLSPLVSNVLGHESAPSLVL